MGEKTAELRLFVTCTTCGESKPREAFFPHRLKLHDAPKGRTRRTRGSQCKSCMKADYERAKLADPVHWLFMRVKHRAKLEGKEFTITEKDIFIPECCPLLGIKLAPPGKAQTVASPTLDRLDATKGYVPGNVEVMSRNGNALKGNGTAEQHERIAAWMRSKGLK